MLKPAMQPHSPRLKMTFATRTPGFFGATPLSTAGENAECMGVLPSNYVQIRSPDECFLFTVISGPPDRTCTTSPGLNSSTSLIKHTSCLQCHRPHGSEPESLCEPTILVILEVVTKDCSQGYDRMLGSRGL